MTKEKILSILESAKDKNGAIPMSLVRKAFEKLPSAQPEIVRCKDCKFYRCDGCFFSTAETEENGFCHYAERRTDEAQNEQSD